MKTIATAVAALVLSAGLAAADDKAACAKGIEFIKAQIAAKPADAVMKKLNKALKDANREQGEAEYDECLDAVKDAEKATGKKAS